MEKRNQLNPRREFLGTVAAGAAVSLAAMASPLSVFAGMEKNPSPEDADKWFDKVGGTHRVVYDSPEPKGIMPFVWSRVFLLTNQATGSTEKDCGVVVVLRHEAIPFAFAGRD